MRDRRAIKILVVDDRPDIRLLLAEFLSIEGYTVIQASDADQAVRLAQDENPVLIIMDIMMPGRDGLSAVQEIRSRDTEVGIIMLTASSTEMHAIRALQAGADDYMHKPFEPTELNARVRSAIERSELRKENQRLQERLAAILEHYLPQPVAQALIVAPEMPHLGGERHEVTILFADLRGFTSFTTMTPPDELVLHLNRYLSAAAEAILKYNGTVDKFLGDGMMAIFNAPALDQDHVLNAVRAALEVHKQVGVMCAADGQRRSGGFDLRFGVGIHTGEAIVGNIGAARLMNYTAVGDTVNVTKRLEEHAMPGQILVSQAVVDALGGRLVVEALDPVEVSGRTERLPVFQILGIVD